jgi:3'(2'), 5'-bisphosphate nucleotidase
MEWETPAGDAVLRAAGGMTLDLDEREFRYGKTRQASDSDFANGHFVAWGARR